MCPPTSGTVPLVQPSWGTGVSRSYCGPGAANTGSSQAPFPSAVLGSPAPCALHIFLFQGGCPQARSPSPAVGTHGSSFVTGDGGCGHCPGREPGAARPISVPSQCSPFPMPVASLSPPFAHLVPVSSGGLAAWSLSLSQFANATGRCFSFSCLFSRCPKPPPLQRQAVPKCERKLLRR